jgi:hypothetical protein
VEKIFTDESGVLTSLTQIPAARDESPRLLWRPDSRPGSSLLSYLPADPQTAHEFSAGAAVAPAKLGNELTRFRNLGIKNAESSR